MKNELNWNMLYQISEAITKIKKIRHTKKFQNKIDKMILEYQNEFSEKKFNNRKWQILYCYTSFKK